MNLYTHPSRPLLISATLAFTFFATGCSWTSSSTPEPKATQNVEQPRSEPDGTKPLSEAPVNGQENPEIVVSFGGGRTIASDSNTPNSNPSVGEFRDASEPSPRAKTFGTSLNVECKEETKSDKKESVIEGDLESYTSRSDYRYRHHRFDSIYERKDPIITHIRGDVIESNIEEGTALTFEKAREYITIAEQMRLDIHSSSNSRQHTIYLADEVLSACHIVMYVLKDLVWRYYSAASAASRRSYYEKRDGRVPEYIAVECLADADTPFFRDMTKRLEISLEYRELAQRAYGCLLEMKPLVLRYDWNQMINWRYSRGLINGTFIPSVWLGNPEYCLVGQSIPEPTHPPLAEVEIYSDTI